MEIYWSLLVCLVGLVLFFVFPQPPSSPNSQKLGAVGLHMFWVGLFVFLLNFGGTVSLLRK